MLTNVRPPARPWRSISPLGATSLRNSQADSACHTVEVQREDVWIIGAGTVGLATGQALSSLGHRVGFVDTSTDRRETLAREGIQSEPNLPTPSVSSIILVCVPTPSVDEGYDLKIFRQAVNSTAMAISSSSATQILAIRSTVPPQTIDSIVIPALNAAGAKSVLVASAPEFLRERSALDDALHPSMTVIGSRSEECRNRLCSLFGPLGGTFRVFDDHTTAEMIKITHNCLNATKISFFNEIHRIASSIGVDSGIVAEAVVRSAEAMTNRDYGTNGGYPFGGSCLPKDLDGLIGFSKENGIPTPLLEATRAPNASFRATTN